MSREEIEKFIEEHKAKIPYIKVNGNGMYEIFTGTETFWGNKALANMWMEAIKKVGELYKERL